MRCQKREAWLVSVLQVGIDAALLENDRCCRIDLVGLCADSMAALGYGWLRPGQAGD